MSTSKLFRTFGQKCLQSGVAKNNSFNGLIQNVRNYSAAAYTTRYSEYECLQVSAPYDHILHVQLNRPDVRNAMNREVFREIQSCFKEINDDKQCRAVVVSSIGKTFSSGLDFVDMIDMIDNASKTTGDTDVALRAKFLRSMIQLFQQSFNQVVRCSKPVISAIHGACVGSGLDLISSTDIRYCSSDAFFAMREVNIGMAADLGSLQRLPRIVGNDSLIRELAYTARNMPATEAKECGLVSKVFADQETTIQAAMETAQKIVVNSPVAVQGTKIALNYSRNHTIQDGLEFMANWNMCMLQADDLSKAAKSVANRSDKPPIFNDL